MTSTTLVLFVTGIVLLVAGAEVLVRGASRLAARLGLAPLVIGLTVVAFGTSAPELAVSLQAGLSGQAAVAMGNVVGSNIFNVLFILGLSAAISPLVVAQQLVRLDVPLVIGASLLVLLLSLDGRVGRLEGLLLTCGIVTYTVVLLRHARGAPAAARAEGARPTVARSGRAGSLPDILMVVAGLALLVLGSRWLVDGAVAIAQSVGVSELVIGLTIVAAGTSLPEVATSVIASLRGERDIAVGNVLGSCLFNLLAILGISSAVAPGGIVVPPSMIGFDLPVMIAVSIACLPIFMTGARIDRWEGLFFLFYYAAYTAYLILDATGHDALPILSTVMGVFVLPITLVTLAVLAVRARRDGPESG